MHCKNTWDSTLLSKKDQSLFTLVSLRSKTAFYPLKAFNIFHHKVVVFIMCGRSERDSFFYHPFFFFLLPFSPPNLNTLFWRHRKVVVLSFELSFPGVCCQGVWGGKHLTVLWWLSNHACIRPQLEAGCLHSSGCNADIYMLRSFKKQDAAEHLWAIYIYFFSQLEGQLEELLLARCKPAVCLWFQFMGWLRAGSETFQPSSVWPEIWWAVVVWSKSQEHGLFLMY